MNGKREEKAVNYYLNGLNCAQSVLLVFNDFFDFNENTSQKLTSAFGGGMGEGKTCGVIIGGLIVLGLKYGYSIPIDEIEKTNLFEKVEAFKSAFLEIHKSLVCKELIGHDLSIPKDKEKALAENTFNTVCPDFVNNAVTILEKLIHA
ncbi:C-GCAxxG-C-C family protein [Bacteroidota bacterium]